MIHGDSCKGFSKDNWIPQWCSTVVHKRLLFSSLNHRWFTCRENPEKSCLVDCMRKPKNVSSSLNHPWFYSYGKPLKFLFCGLYEKTHKGFISKPLKLSLLTIEIFAGKILVNCDIKMLAEQNLSKYCIVCGSYFSIFSLDFMTQAII